MKHIGLKKKEILFGLFAFCFLVATLGIAGTIDYNEQVIYNMSDNIYHTIREKVGNSDRAIVKEYMSNKAYYDLLQY